MNFRDNDLKSQEFWDFTRCLGKIFPLSPCRPSKSS